VAVAVKTIKQKSVLSAWLKGLRQNLNNCHIRWEHTRHFYLGKFCYLLRRTTPRITGHKTIFFNCLEFKVKWKLHSLGHSFFKALFLNSSFLPFLNTDHRPTSPFCRLEERNSKIIKHIFLVLFCSQSERSTRCS